MKVEKTEFDGLFIIHLDVYNDDRGWFSETYQTLRYKSEGIIVDFVQDNHSFSKNKGTLRGLHFQTGEFAQSKLIRCISGEILDVVVDLRSNSKTYKKYYKIKLNSKNGTQLFIPKGFAHGFLCLSDDVEIEYKVDNVYSKAHDAGIRFDDEILAIDWEIDDKNGIILSQKDEHLPRYDAKKIYF